MQTMDRRKCIGQRLAKNDRQDRESSAKAQFVDREPPPGKSLAGIAQFSVT